MRRIYVPSYQALRSMGVSELSSLARALDGRGQEKDANYVRKVGRETWPLSPELAKRTFYTTREATA